MTNFRYRRIIDKTNFAPGTYRATFSVTDASGNARIACFNTSGTMLTNLNTTAWSIRIVIVLIGTTF